MGGYEGENGIVVFKLMNEYYIVYIFFCRLFYFVFTCIHVLLFCI